MKAHLACILSAVVLGAAAPLPAAQLPTWSVQRISRIGSIDDPEQALSWVSGVLIDSHGRLHILQPQDDHVVVFESSGKRLRTIGRSGQGPGEFDVISAAGFRRDTLFVADDALRRVSFFDSAGSFIRTVQVASPAFGTPPVYYFSTVPQVLLPDGTGLVKPNVPPALMATGDGRVPYMRIDQNGAVLDTLAWESLPLPTFPIVNAGTRFFAQKPFPQTPLFHIMADGSGVLVVERPTAADGRQAAFQVTNIGIDGDTLFSKAHSYTPEPLDRQQIESAVIEIEARLAARPNAPNRGQIERALRDASLIPDYRSPVEAVASALDGSIWLRRGSRDPEGNWTVLGSNGEVIAHVALPAGQVVMAVRDDVLAALELDSLDVPYVVTYRIRR